MKVASDPKSLQQLQHGLGHFLKRVALKTLHPGLEAAGEQLREDCNFDGIELVLPTTLFDERYELDLDGTKAQLIYVGPCHQVGDTIIHVPSERVVFAALTQAGQAADAAALYRQLLVVTTDPARRAVLQRELEQLRLVTKK